MISDWLAPLITHWPDPARYAAIGAVIAVIVMARYGLLTAAGFGLSLIVDRIAPRRRLQAIPFTAAQIRREIAYSMSSVLVFTGVVGGLILLTQAGWTQLYRDPKAFGWTWFWLQIPVVLLIQDFYFYWMHRAIHRPGVYERVHKAHHLSTNPSAFSAFAFHPLEALLEIAFAAVLILVMPLSTHALLTVGLLSLLYNVYGHLGYEVMPRFIGKSPVGLLMNKSAYHNQHHRTYRYNYGLYTVIWDRLFGTFHPKAEQLYDEKSDFSRIAAAAKDDHSPSCPGSSSPR